MKVYIFMAFIFFVCAMSKGTDILISGDFSSGEIALFMVFLLWGSFMSFIHALGKALIIKV